MRLDLRASAAGFLGAAAVLGTLAYLVGVEDLLFALSLAETSVAGAVLAAAAVWLTAWALALRTVLEALEAAISPWR
ncbi:TIGR00374 family protein, partial [Halobacteriales archaeon QS_9_68_42]